MIRESFQALALCFSLIAATPALAQDAARTVGYPVDGRTAAEVLAYIKTKSPRVAANATFAFTKIVTKTDKPFVKAKGKCRYARVKTTALYDFVIPHHSNPKALDTSIRKAWAQFTEYLRVHEDGHRVIWQACLKQYDAEAMALTAADCDTLEKTREKLFTRIKRGCLQQDEAYDVQFRKDVLQTPFMRAALAPPR